MNDSTWEQLHGLSPEAMVTGDMDGDTLDDVIVDFGINGTWIWINDTSWVALPSP